MARLQLLDRGKRELLLFAAFAVGLILLRCFPATWYEQFNFDSDQAIVGLMAKHLSEGRAFPLFFYGQHYMLGVQSWIAAPLFLVGGPTIMMLRLPLVIINCLAGVLLLVLVNRRTGLRPATSFAVVLPFLMPAPLVSALLLQTLGASVEPFVYVLLLWILRRRPVLFGLVLSIGVLHREFTIFAVPALFLVLAAEGSLFTRATLERVMTTIVVIVGVWLVVDLLKAGVDVYGPTTGRPENSPLNLEMQAMLHRLCLQPVEILARARSMFVDCLPDLFGGRTFRLEYYGVNSRLTTGMTAMGWVLAGTGVPMAARLSALVRSGTGGMSFPVYLVLVGAQAIAVYPLACEVQPGYPGIVRYVLLGLLVPIGLSAEYLRREPVRVLRGLAVCVLLAWAAANLTGNARLIHEYQTNTPDNKSRDLADYLVAHNVRYGRADYWDAYVIDFLSRERVIIGSEGKFRIKEYENTIDRNRPAASRIVRQPCSVGTPFMAWCIQGPPR